MATPPEIIADSRDKMAKAVEHLEQLEHSVRREVATEFQSSPALEKEPTLHDLYFRR